MAVTIVGSADTISTAFNTVAYYVSSLNSNKEAFKYIVDIYDETASSRLARMKLFPRPTDLYGEAIIDSVLRSQVGGYLSPNNHGFAFTSGDFYRYQLKLGEEYTFFMPYGIIYDSGNGFVTLSGQSSTPHQFQIGDEVAVTNPLGGAFPAGTYNVVALPSTKAVTIDLPVTVPMIGAFYNGSVVFSNHRTNVYSGQTTLSGLTVFNAALPYRSLNEYSSTNYTLSFGTMNGLATKKFLTNVTNDWTVRRENSMWLHLVGKNFNSTAPSLEFSGNTGHYVFSNTGTTSINADRFAAIAAGPADLAYWSAYDTNHNIVQASTFLGCDLAEYSVRLGADMTTSSVDSGGTVTWGTYQFLPTTEWKRFKVSTLEGRHTNVELYFMDRLGSYIPANFELMSARQIDRSDSSYRAIVGGLDASIGRWQATSTEAARRQINTTVVEQLTVNTNWVSVAESNYFAELLTSPSVYIKEFGKLWPVIVTTTNLPLPTKANMKNINRVLNIEYSNQDRIQDIY